MVGKVTVGLAADWPCVTHLSGLSTFIRPQAQGLSKVDEYTAYTPRVVWRYLPFSLVVAVEQLVGALCVYMYVCVFSDSQ